MKTFDVRGFNYSIKELPFIPNEIFISYTNKNVLKGLHKNNYKKYINIIKGKIYDIYYKDNILHQKILSEGDSLLIPENSYHGYFSLENSEVIYLLENKYKEEDCEYAYWWSPTIINLYNLKVDVNNCIINNKDLKSKYIKKYKYLILGGNGYLGKWLVKYLDNYLIIDDRLNDTLYIEDKIIKSECKYIICAAGISGKPTTEWCENNQYETFETNFLNILNLCKLIKKLNLHLTILGSGGVYDDNYNEITEDVIPSYNSEIFKKIYFRYRILLENEIRTHFLKNVLYLRIMYPCSFDNSEKCLINKLNKNINNINNYIIPITIIPNLFPYIPFLINKNIDGILNFINGNIKIEQILNFYKKKYTLNNNIKVYKLSNNLLSEYIGEKITSPIEYFNSVFNNS